MDKYMALVTPLTNRKIKKSCEQAFVSTVLNIDTSVQSIKEAGIVLGLSLPDALVNTLETNISTYFNKPSDLLDARYIVALSIKNIITGSRPLYKVPLGIEDYSHLKRSLTKTVSVA